jgi:hypothetical protein
MTSRADYIYTAQSTGPFTPSKAYAVVGGSGRHKKNHFLSFFVGYAGSGALAKYWGGTGTYSVDSSWGPVSCGDGRDAIYEVQMAPVNDAMCHFTNISSGDGDWNGNGEYVAIYPKTVGTGEYWFLRGQSNFCERAAIAQARCFKRDQR